MRSVTDEHGRVLSALFMDLPLAEDYPDYYDVIKHPVSLSQLKSTKFTNKDDFKSTFLSIFSNAQAYPFILVNVSVEFVTMRYFIS